jgi:hypothetical protein
MSGALLIHDPNVGGRAARDLPLVPQQAPLAVETGLEPAISTLTGWRGLRLPYTTMILQLGRLASNQHLAD